VNADVCVVGAGPAGAAAAIALARTGARVLLIGSAKAPPAGTLELLSGHARHSLDTLGLTGTVVARAPVCAATISRWGGADFAERAGILDPAGPGWVVDRHWLNPVFLAASRAAGVRHLPAQVTGAVRDGLGWTLHCADGAAVQLITTPRVIVASGRTGRVAARFGLSRTTGHRMVAMTAWLPGDPLRLGHRLLVDHGPGGWWYALGDTRGTSVVHCTDADLLRPGTWRDAARDVGWAATLRPAHRPALRAAPTGRAVAATGPGVTLAGDAALAVDPLSGRGLTLALETALAAARDERGYGDWLAERTRAHARQARAVYGMAGETRDFWRRRAVPV
jgi:flavin-dependent dehydrogenase